LVVSTCQTVFHGNKTILTMQVCPCCSICHIFFSLLPNSAFWHFLLLVIRWIECQPRDSVPHTCQGGMIVWYPSNSI
jgi:hypothetical protein